MEQSSEECRYQMTEHGVAIREPYTVTLISAQEAIDMTNWLIWHYVELYKLAGEQARREKAEESYE